MILMFFSRGALPGRTLTRSGLEIGIASRKRTPIGTPKCGATPSGGGTPSRTRRTAVATAACLGLLAASGCQSGSQEPIAHLPTVVASVYPLAYVVRSIGGSLVNVNTIAAAGVEPHEQELTPKQAAEIQSTSLLVYVAGISPAVDAAAAQTKAMVVEGLAALGPYRRDGDPHLWLNPLRLADVGSAVANALSDLDRAHAADYQSRAAAFRTQMTTLDQQIRDETTTCSNRVLITTHTAFGYFAGRYQFRQVSILGANPDAEATPATIARLVQFARANKVTTVYTELPGTDKPAKAVASETGASVRTLDTLEAPANDTDYVTAMRANAATVAAGQGCR